MRFNLIHLFLLLPHNVRQILENFVDRVHAVIDVANFFLSLAHNFFVQAILLHLQLLQSLLFGPNIITVVVVVVVGRIEIVAVEWIVVAAAAVAANCGSGCLNRLDARNLFGGQFLQLRGAVLDSFKVAFQLYDGRVLFGLLPQQGPNFFFQLLQNMILSLILLNCQVTAAIAMAIATGAAVVGSTVE